MTAPPDTSPETDGLAILGSAIAGRPVRIGHVEPGEPSWTDGLCVYLDPAASHAQRRLSLTVHAALIAAGGLDPAVVRRLGRRPGPAARYLVVEGHRALLAHERLLPRDAALRVDRGIAGLSDCPYTSLAVATGRRPLPDPPAWFGVLRVRAVLGAQAAAARPVTGSAYHPRSRQSGDPELHAADDADEAPALPDLFTNPIGGGGSMLGRLLGRMLGAVRRSDGQGHPGADSAVHRGLRVRRGAGTVAAGSAEHTETPGPDDSPATAITYPEWDMHRRRYRPGWCTVLESAPDPASDSRMPPWNAHALRRPLTRLGTAPGLYRRRPQGDDLDIDAVVESRVETLSGSTPDETVYLATRRLRRDLSVLILLDISGSVAEPGGGGTPVHEQQRTAAAALMSVLHELGDRVALYAFRSQGRTAVHLVPVKRFDEVFGATVLRRLRGLRPGAYSRLGAAIRHGTTVLRTGGGTGNKLLLVLSDGLAYDHGYERAYGSADARRALAETRLAGIGCLCLTIGASTGDADLAKVFGSAAHIAVPEAGRLAGVIGPLFRHALFSARAGANRR